MTVMERDITDIASAIWSTMIEPAGSVTRTDDLVGPTPVNCAVHIGGVWRGAVLFRCGESTATDLTRALLGADGEPTADDVRDAVGELTNMLAGNIKALLPGPSTLSLPAVALGANNSFGVPGSREVDDVSLLSSVGVFRVTLVQDTSDVTP
jgi:CheY-specific phosphatase CheX